MGTQDLTLGQLIDSLIDEKANGNAAIAETTKGKLILKGIYLESYIEEPPKDHPEILEKLIEVRNQWYCDQKPKKDTFQQTVSSNKTTEEEVVLEIQSLLALTEVKVVIYFASPTYDQDNLARLMEKAFDGCVVIGCSSAGEQFNDQMLDNSVVAMALCPDVIVDAKVEVANELKDDVNLKPAFNNFNAYFDENLSSTLLDNYVGIVLTDGLSMKEEDVIDSIGNLTSIDFIGGSAGDNNAYQETYVHANGNAYKNAAALLLLKLHDNANYHIINSNAFHKLPQKLVATKVNIKQREVIEFNHKPATEAYAEAIDVPINAIEKYFNHYPLGLFFGQNKMMVRAPKRVKNTAISFRTRILEGMEVNLLERGDIVTHTQKIMDKHLKSVKGNRVCMISFDSILRKKELEKNNQTVAYGKLFSDFQSIGFYGYGQTYIGQKNYSVSILLIENDIEEENKSLNKATERTNTKKERQLLELNYDLMDENRELNHQLDLIVSELRNLNKDMAEEIEKRINRENEMAYYSYHDELTGLSNRHFMSKYVENVDTAEKLPVSIIYGDLNDLKTINDVHGHSLGNELIQKAASAIKHSCRETDIVVRLGGDEFLGILPNTSMEAASNIVKRIKANVGKEMVGGNPISISLGYATKETPEESIEEVIRAAELYMYAEKKIYQEKINKNS